MLDIKFIRENPEKVKNGLEKRRIDFDIAAFLAADKKRREMLSALEDLRSQKNKANELIQTSSAGEKEKIVLEMRELDKNADRIAAEFKEINGSFQQLLRGLPNLPLDDVPAGKDEKDNVVLREEGSKPRFDFEPKDYLEIAEKLDIIDTKRAAKVSGSRFGYLKGEAALLEFALAQLAFEALAKEGFTPVIPPVLIREEMMRAMGYIDTEEDLAERYCFDKDKLFLVGTSEQSMGPMHADEVFDEKDLPRRYAAFSTCFRREAGSYGKDTKGILRVHQFDKVEMFSFCHPEKSREEHKFLMKTAEGLMQKLKLPYRVVQLCAGDLARPAAATYDIESWMPGQNQHRETHSISNCTDFQARRLNIRYKKRDGKMEFVHMLNGTALAMGRMLIAIIENYQQKDGSVKFPDALSKYFNFKKIQK
ncbi:MAG: serine--tRNA ligase [Candidatus Wildermuthbacteria bacterium RIFCSPHIGHO2_01_FULL_47_27]|uniref:Serine--tRNA ligase n=2 Tax=Candidatus Wildermuthiibacteriota TaxID=1817923 RepID=A0A1G2RSJ2_9BACT|nr:MAG: Serine-tRNA ligase [Parcubacteria group bacterium GW2011_GWA2_47_9]OHA63345.1 MAG: serine--tRNA ligase [Candidatus Wildermuthbacteria bacterium RIFCSPHIGHO2_01_FULL_47_27]OHA66949.1 MAG: serine--tRNA ligase [Candidatus Wildermuthbacteria bacterium RIFCSPHIGHO2_02_FULL_47_17]OHA75825.1 MAG: serine--tRNA ligase [Candidatus Wildermuthbacteria bacterium RIFCSPLOWO2_01_FULL_48_35]OHA76549.1 MAG: serine--tRNA ligase [Candidatus Wildermuthbacteria bacterium RIFCSPLOWO2_02_FULL_47_10]